MSRTVFAGRDPHFVYRPLLDLIGKSEGTDKGRGYNETLAYGAYTGGDVELVAMTLNKSMLLTINSVMPLSLTAYSRR